MNHKLAKAISMAFAGVAMTVGTGAALAGTTMYNTFNQYPSAIPTDANANGTDGWVYGFGVAPGAGTPNFVGTAASSTLPFGYAGGGILNWAVQLTGSGDSATISSADAHSRYGVYADIDVAGGSWSDANAAGASGWRHNTDYGLFKADTTADITLSAVGVTNTDAFGFTIFKGMDASTVAYSHHGGWNSGNNATGLTSNSLPGGNTTFSISDIVAYSVGGASPQNISNITFHAVAGQVYTILMGGYRTSDWGTTSDGYVLNVSSAVSAVPVPGAVWLFGSAVAGMVGFGRGKAFKQA